MIVLVNNKEYECKEAHTDEEKRKGLQGVEHLPENEDEANTDNLLT